jgi:hypothetical protein
MPFQISITEEAERQLHTCRRTIGAGWKTL